MKFKTNLILAILAALLILSGCGAPTSISTSVGCTGYMLVENSSYKKKASKIRENKVKHRDKSYLKSHRGN